MDAVSLDSSSALQSSSLFAPGTDSADTSDTALNSAMRGMMPGLGTSIKEPATGQQDALPGETSLNNLIQQGSDQSTALLQQIGQQGDAAIAADQQQVAAGAAGSAGVASNGKASDGTRIPQPDDKRPAGDNRTAQQIIDDNPTLKNLGNQSGVRDALKKQVGDYTTDPDAAYRASEVVNYIKSSNASDGSKRSSDVTGDGKIEGFTKDGDARHGTEAGELQDFGKNGYSQLTNDDHNLQTTTDTHVNKDGTNKDNFQWGMEQVGDVLGKIVSAIPGIGQIASMFGA